MWQKCPVCNGLGTVPASDIYKHDKKCPTCSGKGIISTLTGKPPADGSGELNPNRETQQERFGI